MNEVELAVALANAQQWAQLAGITLIVVGVLLAVLPVGECSQCVHCRHDRARKTTRLCPQHHKPEWECRDEHRP